MNIFYKFHDGKHITEPEYIMSRHNMEQNISQASSRSPTWLNFISKQLIWKMFTIIYKIVLPQSMKLLLKSGTKHKSNFQNTFLN